SQERRCFGVHRRLRRARSLAGTLRPSASLCGRHVPARPLWPHRIGLDRGDWGELSRQLYVSRPNERPENAVTQTACARARAGTQGRQRIERITPGFRVFALLALRARFARPGHARLTLIAIGLSIAIVLSASACWIVSLGPAPRGDALAFSTLVVDR